jgi:hypothetical protein
MEWPLAAWKAALVEPKQSGYTGSGNRKKHVTVTRDHHQQSAARLTADPEESESKP